MTRGGVNYDGRGWTITARVVSRSVPDVFERRHPRLYRKAEDGPASPAAAPAFDSSAALI